MTSSQMAEAVPQPVAPVALMSTGTHFDLDHTDLFTYPKPSHNSNSPGFAEQDKSIAAAMETTLPSSSAQLSTTGLLPEIKNSSTSEEAPNTTNEMGNTGSEDNTENNVPSQPKEPIDSAMDMCNATIKQASHEKEPNDTNPEIFGHASQESTGQPTQEQPQLSNLGPVASFPPYNTTNVHVDPANIYGADMNLDGSVWAYDQTMDFPNVASNPEFYNRQPLIDPGVQLDGYAKLAFDDSDFYMTTHELVIGRDQTGYNNMRRYEKEHEAMNTSEFSSFKPTMQIESHTGGIMDPWVKLAERRSRKGKKSKGSRSISGNSATAGSLLPAANGNVSLQNPDPHSCPVLHVHPPFNKGVAGFKAISREHVKIFYDDHQDSFKVEFLGRNGGFVDDIYFEPKQIAPLVSGSKLQMGFVFFRFLLPDVVIDDTGFQYHEEPEEEATATATTTYSEGGKEMSLSFDDAPRAGDQRSTDSECSSDNENNFGVDEIPDNEVDRVGDPDALYPIGEAIDDEQDAEEEESPIDNLTDSSPQPTKKRGPGRPPKNGVMSKREQQIAKKEALERERIQEEERAQEEQRVEEQNQATASKTVPGKNKVGRPRKHPRPDVTEEGPPRQKRKYTKRQSGPKTPEEADEDRFDDDGNCIQAKNGSSRKVAYVLKEVTHKREDFTADQLSRPPKNYLQVIFELLKQAEQPLCLPQIYNEMEVQYPYYAFQESKGWQSSVRHNLGQHECFERTKRAGKGWAWTLKPGSSYLKEKKKRAPSPPVAGGNQPIYQAGPQVSGYGQPPPGYMLNPNLYHNQINPHAQGEYQQYQPGQPYMGPNPHYSPYPPQGYHPPQGIQPPFIPPMAPQLVPSAPASYSSPYAPKLPAAGTQSQGTQQQPSQQQPQQQHPQQQHLQQQHTQQQHPQQQSQQQQPQHQSQQQQHPQQHPQHSQPQHPYSQPQQPHYQSPQPPKTNQAPVQSQQQQQPPPTGHQTQAAAHAAPQVTHGAVPAATPQKRVIPPNLVAAITAYRNHVANLIRKRAPNDAEAIVDKAINRVYDGTEEDRSLDSTEHEMKLINGVLNILKLPPVPRAPSASQNHSQPQPAVPQQVPQPPINQNKPQGNMSQQSGKPIGADLPKQTIMRPSFFGTNQNQSSNSSVPRPPLMTPVLQRSNSVSAPTPSRPNTASSSSVPSGLSNPPSQTAVSGNNKISGTTPPVASIVNQTIAQPVDQNGANEKGTNQSGATQIGTNRHGTSQNGTNHGLKAGETLTEAGFVRSFPHPPISS
ncbi:hypothetical protein BCIN_04g04160 [Botrytis cinerea B05.10]|uniref:Fork-head domain-containing protein n=1 Tax=Botryotinia fuckeliana (strain B05.10) TaxID=332648 RepID=A0A384JG16_BOTFB|nr:hypothetical protein BCIN_04g04160 [Botrytis cinerea B05.10]ATZ49244.1 hypothetical protein BCIN_04g04160 [Botrytis cinerea B05.10]